jgi:hypothetical protein
MSQLWEPRGQEVRDHHCNPPPAGQGFVLGQQWRCAACRQPLRWDGRRWRTEAEFRGEAR